MTNDEEDWEYTNDTLGRQTKKERSINDFGGLREFLIVAAIVVPAFVGFVWWANTRF